MNAMRDGEWCNRDCDRNRDWMRDGGGKRTKFDKWREPLYQAKYHNESFDDGRTV